VTSFEGDLANRSKAESKVAVLGDSAHRGLTTVSIFPSLRLVRLGLVLSGLLGAMAHADERSAHNSLYLELGGSGLLWSANYDRMFGEYLSLRVGVEGLEFDPLCDCKSFFFVVPVTASALVGPGAHKLELGLGATTFIGTTDSTGYRPTPTVWATGVFGYRYAPKQSGFMFRATFTPVFGYLSSRGAQPIAFPWGGISVGYQF
jgi:hypothetical protein